MVLLDLQGLLPEQGYPVHHPSNISLLLCH